MVMADFFHMDIEESDAPAAIERVGGLIGHVHLADNQRKEPGSGDLDFARNFRALKKIGFDGYMAFGVRPHRPRRRSAAPQRPLFARVSDPV